MFKSFFKKLFSEFQFLQLKKKNQRSHAILILVERTLSAENRTEQSIAFVHLTISAILTAPAGLNVSSTQIASEIRVAQITDALILVRERAGSMQTVE